MRPTLSPSARCASCAALQPAKNPKRVLGVHCFVHPEKVPHGCRCWSPRQAAPAAQAQAVAAWGERFLDSHRKPIVEPLPPRGLPMTFDPARGLVLKKTF